VPPPRQDPIWTRVVLIALLLFITYLAFRMLQSFLNVIILAILSASFASPLRRWLLLRLKDRRTLAAGITTVVIILTGVLPVTVFTIALVNQTASLVQISTKWIQEGHLDKLLSSPRLERWVAKAEEHLGLIFPIWTSCPPCSALAQRSDKKPCNKQHQSSPMSRHSS